jgi:asparagine synthase (glutamine-hydrolysing)
MGAAGADEGIREHIRLTEYVRRRKPSVLPVIEQVLAERLTFLPERRLVELAAEVLAIEEQELPGSLVEAGCALGGSAIVLTAAKERARRLYLYDVFGMIPTPGLTDGWKAWKLTIVNRLGLRKGHGGDRYYGYVNDLLGTVVASFHRFGFELEEENVVPIKGRHEVTLSNPVHYRVALAHIDSDWHRSVEVGVRALEPKLVPGGRIVFDDYYSFPGCRSAVDEYFDGARGARYERIGLPTRSSLHLVRATDAPAPEGIL